MLATWLLCRLLSMNTCAYARAGTQVCQGDDAVYAACSFCLSHQCGAQALFVAHAVVTDALERLSTTATTRGGVEAQDGATAVGEFYASTKIRTNAICQVNLNNNK